MKLQLVEFPMKHSNAFNVRPKIVHEDSLGFGLQFGVTYMKIL